MKTPKIKVKKRTNYRINKMTGKKEKYYGYLIFYGRYCIDTETLK